MDIREKIIKDINAFLKKHNLTSTEFGVVVANDRSLVRDIEKGRDIGIKTIEKIYKHIDSKEYT